MPLREFDLEFEEHKVHCYEGGSGFPLLLLHGSGAGTSTSSNWALVLDSLASNYHVLAADLVGFGLSSRKSVRPFFDLGLWVRQAEFLFDHVANGGIGGLIGHSLSGFVALRLAAQKPQLVKVAVTGCPGARFRVSQALDIAWSFPHSVQELKRMYAFVVATPRDVSEEFFERRLDVLRVPGYAEYFEDMFSGNKQAYLDQLVLTSTELANVKAEVLFIHGERDRVVPFIEGTLPVVQSIAAADAILLGNCGHGPALEQPDKFLRFVGSFFAERQRPSMAKRS